MKIKRHLIGLLCAIPFFTSCDEHTFEDASWHSWTPGMVYCSNGEVMTFENCQKKGNTPEAVLFFVDSNDEISGKAYAVSLKESSAREFIDPDTTYVSQGTSASITDYDGESNTATLRYFQIASPIAKSISPKYFIPSVAEMYKLYVSRSVVNATIERCGGELLPISDDSCWYWTSTECDGSTTDRAWRYSLSSGRFEMADKHSSLSTRPILSIRLNNAE